MTVGIYAIHDARDNTCLYVGQSQNVENRHKQHLKRLRNNTALAGFVAWFNQNNRDETILRFTLLEEVENTDAAKNEAEILWFRELKPLFYGKEPNANERWSHSDATRQKIADSIASNYKNRLTERTLSCKQCGVAFSSNRRKAQYCSFSCSKKAEIRVPTETLCRLRTKGLTYDEIGAEVRISDVAVWKRLKNHSCTESCIQVRGNAAKDAAT